jgi:hypothetical protein
MMCPFADLLYAGSYICKVDDDFCDDPEDPCESAMDYIDFDDDESFEEKL